MACERVELDAPSLNSRVIGIKNRDITHFRGIPYASVAKRWTHSKTIDRLASPYDATMFGPRSPVPKRESIWTDAAPDGAVIPSPDELRCLNLNITLPTEALGQRSSPEHHIPVMVWIHGGAFYFGANSTARQEPEKLCRMAENAGHPVVIVSINYRLGPLGFAASSDLATELPESNWQGLKACNNDYSGVLGSFGLIDQRNAFQWVHDHIQDFGGDPQRVTAFGVSAGGASIHYHIISGDPLFDRAILMSGTAGTLGPLRLEEYEKAWGELVEKTGARGATAAQRLSQLRAVPAEDVVTLYPRRVAIGPSGDGKLLPTTWTHKDPQPETRCKTIIVGDSKVEAIIMNPLIQATDLASFYKRVRDSFPASIAEEFLATFGFEKTMELGEFHAAYRLFLSITIFQFPAFALTSTYPGETYYYHQEEPSPYEGVTHGHAAHALCSMFLFLNGTDSYPQSARDVSESMTKSWTAFAHGVEPWASFKKAHQFMRFGPRGAITLTDQGSDDERRYRYQGWLDANYEQVVTFCRGIFRQDWGR